MKKLLIFVIAVAILGGAGYSYWHAQTVSTTHFRFDEVKRGRLVATVNATGTLQPREVVDVGAQVAGRIIAIGEDPNTSTKVVYWGSEVEGPVLDKEGNIVKRGTVLAQIDPALYAAQVKSAQAAVQSSRADVLQKQATLRQATADWNRAQRLHPTKGVAQAEYDLFNATFLSATASVEVAKAQVGVAEANLKTAQTNLEYTTISSPVKGVVIDRRVNVGQTVVASLSAPSLFLIAKDLSQMEVWATVNEVDVGKIKVGQKVNFTVDAYPGRVYRGKVVPQGKLAARLNATMNQNVVTYTAVVSADNKDGTLYPYLTTNLSFVIQDKDNELLVPNAALRWQPSRQQIAPDQRDSYQQLRGKKRAPADGDAQDRGFVWVQADDSFVRYIEVRTGLSDAVNTDVLGLPGDGELSEHTRVIVGEGRSEARNGGANPFAPQMFRGAAKPKE